MKRAALFFAVVALVAAPATVFAAEPFSANLTPEAEVPPAECDGCSGSATVTISDDGTSLDYEVSYENLTGDATGAHIHFGGPDVAGPVMIPFEVGDSPFSGTFNEADYAPADGIPETWDEALDAIRNGDTYVNVHTEDNPGGEIRGQLRPLPDTAAAGDEVQTASSPIALLLVMLVGAVAFVLAARRFAFRRT
jgi:hypothetical protein